MEVNCVVREHDWTDFPESRTGPNAINEKAAWKKVSLETHFILGVRNCRSISVGANDTWGIWATVQESEVSRSK